MPLADSPPDSITRLKWKVHLNIKSTGRKKHGIIR